MTKDTESEARQKALDAALEKITKKYGKEAVLRMGDTPSVDIPVTSTGSLPIDIALGVGGIPVGRIVEIYGPEASGKTAFCLSLVAQTQKKGGTAAFIDAEHALDPGWARKLGVDVDNLFLSQPSTGEEALDIVEMYVNSSAVDIIVIDSVAALVPKTELEGDIGDSHMALQARMMSQALRKLTGAAAQNKVTVVFINQLRDKIGGMSFGPSETTTGGKALKFFASIRIDIRRIGAVKDGADVIGNQIRVKIVKNKVATPHKEAIFEFLYGIGFSRENDLIDMGVAANLVKKSGAWFNYEGAQLGQGKVKSRAFLVDNPELADELEDKLREMYLPSQRTVEIVETDSEE